MGPSELACELSSDEGFGLSKRWNVQIRQNVAQVLPRYGRSHGANGYAQNTGRLALPGALAIGPRCMVVSVLQHTGDRAVILGRHEQKAVGGLDIALQSERTDSA